MASLRRSGIPALLTLLAREAPPLASLLPLLPLQARCSSPTGGISSPVRARCFPQPLWITRCYVRRRRDDRCGLPRQRHGAALAWRCQPLAQRGGRGSRPSGFPEIPSRASGTALRRQGRSVARAAGPRHRRPRLRHRTRRRGYASAASRPPQARARVVEKVRQAAQPPADRSVQRLIQRRRWTAPANCWAARRYSGPPWEGQKRSKGRCAFTSPIRPPGAEKEGTGAAALCPCR